MTRSPRDTGRPHPAAVLGPLLDATLFETARQNLAAATLARQHAVERLGRLYDEGLRFMGLRLEANRCTMRELTGCRTLPETMAAWTEYFDLSARQYTEEAEVVASLCSDQARAVIEEVQHQVGETLAQSAPIPAQGT